MSMALQRLALSLAELPEPVENRCMQSDANQRLIELEIKASYSEDLLDELNKIVFRQQEQIDALMRDVLQLRQQVPAERLAVARDLRGDMPPHY